MLTVRHLSLCSACSLGRRPAFFIYLFIECFFGVATAFAQDFVTWSVFRFGVGFTVPAILGTPYVLGECCLFRFYSSALQRQIGDGIKGNLRKWWAGSCTFMVRDEMRFFLSLLETCGHPFADFLKPLMFDSRWADFHPNRKTNVEVTERKLHNEELNDVYCSPNILRVIKSRRMRWAGHVACMEGEMCTRFWWGNLEGQRPLGRPTRRWEDNIKMDFR